MKSILIGCLFVACLAPHTAASGQPNLLFILTDDQGWTTPSCYGNTHVQTPSMDRLANEGVRFSDAYVMPQCTPTVQRGEALRQRFQEFDNAPLREGKGSVYEGGIRVPCIVRWPGVARPGTVNNTPIHVIDWLPTLLTAAGAEVDIPVDGVDITPLLRGDRLPDRSLFWYAPLYDLTWASTPAAIIRDGDWKLIQYFGDWFDEEKRYQLGDHVELYNLRNDLSESRDLASEQPERAAEMRARLNAWITSCSATVPTENPHFDPEKGLFRTKEKQPWNE